MLRVKKGRESVNIARLKSDCAWPEKVLVSEWRKLQHQGNGIPTALGIGATDRDFQVAETLIQWFGSAIGSEWLRSALNKIYSKKSHGSKCAVLTEHEFVDIFSRLARVHPPWSLGSIRFMYTSMCKMLGFKPNWQVVLERSRHRG